MIEGLADQLTLLRILNANDSEQVLRARQQAKMRQGRFLFGSNKFCQRVPATPNRNHDKNLPRRAVQVLQITLESESEQESSSSGSEEDGSLRRAYGAAIKNAAGKARNKKTPRDRQDSDSDRGQHMSKGLGPGSPLTKCAHCGSKEHGDLDCWKRLVGECCGRRTPCRPLLLCVSWLWQIA